MMKENDIGMEDSSMVLQKSQFAICHPSPDNATDILTKEQHFKIWLDKYGDLVDMQKLAMLD